jgi:hypothetical protein
VSLDERGRTAGRATLATFEALTNVDQDYEQLVHRRRSQRRTRTVAVAIVAVAAVVATFSARGALRADPTPQPAQPAPTHTALGLTAPLIAPESLLDVRTMGFHVEPVPDFDPEGPGAGWSIDRNGQTVTLRWGQVADEVQVRVLYQGEPPPLDADVSGHVADVHIHGAVGMYYERPGGRYPIGGDFDAALAWEYAPGSWASVSAHSDRKDPGPQRLRTALTEVAEAVAAGGDPVRIPLQAHALPTSMPGLSELRGVGVHKGASGWEAGVDFEKIQITTVRGTVAEACDGYEGGTETFTYQGHAGCLTGEGATDQPPAGTAFNYVNAIALQIGDTVRTVVPQASGDWFASHIKRWKQVLAGLKVAQLDDESTWVDLRAVLGA